MQCSRPACSASLVLCFSPTFACPSPTATQRQEMKMMRYAIFFSTNRHTCHLPCFVLYSILHQDFHFTRGVKRHTHGTVRHFLLCQLLVIYIFGFLRYNINSSSVHMRLLAPPLPCTQHTHTLTSSSSSSCETQTLFSPHLFHTDTYTW